MSDSSKDDHTRFRHVGFDDFRAMAKDSTLSRYQKVGFPDMYRADQEKIIFEDIAGKLPAFNSQKATILDIGCGCSDLPHYIIENAAAKSQRLLLVDSQEMLDALPTCPGVEKIAGRYPVECQQLFENFAAQIDAILVYSVLQYVFAEGNIFEFLDKSLTLLAPGGGLLIGDIPNASMRKRFFASEAGAKSHRNFTGKDEPPEVNFNMIEHATIDDAVVLALTARARAAGYHAFVVPQPSTLPMANRREDILIIKP